MSFPNVSFIQAAMSYLFNLSTLLSPCTASGNRPGGQMRQICFSLLVFSTLTVMLIDSNKNCMIVLIL